jgi:glycosyltransferase involved in cell wall biosynthesis
MASKNKVRVFVGIYEVGDYTLCLSRGLRELGFQVTNVVLEIKSPLDKREYRHDRYIRRSGNIFVIGLRLLREFLRQILYHDVFVFNCSRSFLGDIIYSPIKWLRQFAYIDLWLLKRLGKKVVIVVSGSELRSVSLLVEEMRAAGLLQHVKYVAMNLSNVLGGLEEINRKRATALEKYADHIFTRPMSAQFLNRDFHPLWIPIDLRTLELSICNDDPPLVMHAPSNDLIKGTKYVLEAAERLRREGYRFRLELCQNIENIEVRKKLTHSQIVIDQLIFPGYGIFAIEAMASGNAVIGSAVPGYNGFADDMPVLTTTPDTIYQNLKSLLENRSLRTDLAVRGRKWVEKYHDHRVVTRDFVKAIGIECD